MSAQAHDPGTHTGTLIGSASLLQFGDVATVVASGEFDAGTSDGLAAALEAASATGCDVVVDMTGVEFMDGGALRRLETAAAWLAVGGRSLRIDNAPRIIVRLLAAAGVDDLL